MLRYIGRNDEMKYNSLAELAEAYRKKEVTVPMMLDNDDASVWDDDDEVPVDESVLYQGSPEVVLAEALDLLGIPYEHV
jgi:hypothetical protein